VRGNVEKAVAEQRELLDRFNEISAAFAEPDADFDKLMEEQARVQERIDTLDLWNLDNKIQIAMEALRLPPDDADVTKALGGRKAQGRPVQGAARAARHAAARRADQPSRRRERRVAGAIPAEFPGTVVAITHDRYFLDNVAKWILELDRGKGIPWEGNYSSWLDQKKNRLAQEEKTESARQRALQRELEWVRMAPRARRRSRSRASRSTRSSSPRTRARR
jgi:ATPase subunit of ABC transporter with duplicated ATPase domains